MSRPDALLHDALESGRIHSAYLLAGPPEETRQAALRFARALVCSGAGPDVCEACDSCRRSQPASEPPEIDGSGKKGPLYRHIGDHADLFWLERGPDDTRVRIGQVRELQARLRLRSHAGGRRAAVIADAEWLNVEAQNALLHLLEEPPESTSLILVTTSASGLLATVRSRCQRLVWPPSASGDALADDAARAWVARFETLASAQVPEILDFAEEFRGARGQVVGEVTHLLEVGSAWLHARARRAAIQGSSDPAPCLDAFRTLASARKALVQRNANPQMVAERALFALREAAAR
jgi:hypothetical protein